MASPFKIASTKYLTYALRVSRTWGNRGSCRHLSAMLAASQSVRMAVSPPDVRAKRKRVRAFHRTPLNRIINRKWGTGDYRHVPAPFPVMPAR